MADINGNNPGDPGYDPTTDPAAGNPGRTAPPSSSHGAGGGTPPQAPPTQPTAPTIPPFNGGPPPGLNTPPLPTALQSPFTLPTGQQLIENDPGYLARYQMGQQALERGAAARGSLLNGGTIKAGIQYGQDYATNEYQNFVKNQLDQRQQQANDYLNLAYGPAWQQNQSATNQYQTLYKQYQDLISNNRNAVNDYTDWLYKQEQLGKDSVGAPPTSGTSNV